MNVHAADSSWAFGPYRVISPLSAGGAAERYLAQHCKESRLVVIKTPRTPSVSESVLQFYREARFSKMLHHPNLVEVIDSGRCADGRPFLVLEHLRGWDLRRAFSALAALDRQLPVPVVCRILEGVLAGLDHAHELCGPQERPLNLVHRDISPENVMVTLEGTIKVVDFGITKCATSLETLTQPGELKGRFAYMSPEQVARQPLDRRTDIFSTGILGWELLTGRRLFSTGSPIGTLDAICKGKIPKPSIFRNEIPRELDNLVMTALQRDRNKRFGSAYEMGGALANLTARRRWSTDVDSLPNLLRELKEQLPLTQNDGFDRTICDDDVETVIRPSTSTELQNQARAIGGPRPAIRTIAVGVATFVVTLIVLTMAFAASQASRWHW